MIVPDLSGNNPGNPALNGWSGIDPHDTTKLELERDYYAAAAVASFWTPILQTVTGGAARAALGCDNAANLTTGVLDPARIPVMFSGEQVVSVSATIAGLSGAEQTAVTLGSILTLTDGTRWVYSGSGSKTLQASYIQLADITPDWSVIANKPSTFQATMASAAPLDANNSQTGAVGASNNAAKEDHQHPYPGATTNVQSGTTYTLQASDHGKIIEFSNAGAITLTLPNFLGAGFNCSILQYGAGQVTMSLAGGATLRNSTSGTKTRAQYSEIAIRVRANVGGSAAEYVVSGDIA